MRCLLCEEREREGEGGKAPVSFTMKLKLKKKYSREPTGQDWAGGRDWDSAGAMGHSGWWMVVVVVSLTLDLAQVFFVFFFSLKVCMRVCVWVCLGIACCVSLAFVSLLPFLSSPLRHHFNFNVFYSTHTKFKAHTHRHLGI